MKLAHPKSKSTQVNLFILPYIDLELRWWVRRRIGQHWEHFDYAQLARKLLEGRCIRLTATDKKFVIAVNGG